MLRFVLPAALLLLLAPLAPAASAAVGESCVASVWTTSVRVECTGLFYEAATVTWCPNHPLITCFHYPLLTCVVSTTQRPPVTCPPLA